MKQDHQRELARTRARQILARNDTFKRLPVAEQRDMYERVVGEQLAKIQHESDGGLAEAAVFNPMNLIPRGGGGTPMASKMIDDKRHERGFEEGVDAFEDLVDSVDFPAFVRDLLKAVFDANITVMKAQTDDYIRLMKEATTGLAKFIKEVGDDDARAYAAENNPTDLDILVEEDGEGGEKIALTNPQGDKIEGDEEAAILADAKIKMAQEHRHALREMILMGVTRLVVERGEIEAEVNFEFKGTRDLQKSDKAIDKKDTLTQGSMGYGGGLLGSILGGPKHSLTHTEKRTQFSVASTKSTSEDELKAKLRGYVNIKFKTDYFKLDNFAQMYGPPGPEAQQAALQPPTAAPAR